MMPFTNYKIFISGISVAIVIVIVMFYFSSRQNSIANTSANLVAHTQEVLFNSEKLYSAAINIETGERAFLLTQQVQFREMYIDSKIMASSQIKTISRLTADNPVQHLKLDILAALINRRIFFSDSIINSNSATDIAKALEIVKHNQGKVYMDNIRLLIRNMQQEESRLLQIRQAANQRAVFMQHRIFIYSVTGMLVLLIYVFWREKELSLKKEKEKTTLLFRNLLESAADAVIIINAERQIIFINQQTEQLFGYNYHQLKRLPLQTLIPAYLRTGTARSIYEQNGLTKNGLVFPMEISTAPIATDEGPLECICLRDITERKQVAEKLKKSEEFFRLLIAGVKDYAIFMIDTGGKVISWNSGAEHIKGYKENEIIGKSFELFYTKEDLDKGEPFHNLEMAARFGSYEKKGKRLRKNGTIFWANILFTALKDQDNKIYGYCKITRDITEEQRILEQLEFQARQIDQSNDAIYIVDIDIKIKSWNKGAENLYGFTKKEVLGRDPNKVLQTSLTEEELEAALTEVTAQDYWSGELKRTTKAGKEIHVRASTTSARDEEGNIAGYISSSFDITEQKKLLQEVNHLANIVGQTSEAIFSRDMESRIISWNRGAEKLFAISKENALGKTVAELGYLKMDKDELETNRQQLMEEGFWTTEMYLYRKDGSSFFGAVNANTIKDENGQITSFNFIVKDISKRKLLEEQLKRSNMEMEAFSYSVSHDLRAPLRSIIGFTAKLEDKYTNQLDDEAKRLTAIIRNSALKMGTLIDDLLNFSRMGRVEIKRINVDNNTTVNEIINSIDADNGINVEWTIHPLEKVMADLNTIRQVWINLISNAVKYSSKTPTPKIEIGSYKEEGNIIFYVKDNGIGFDEKYKSKLFKVFQRLHHSDEFEGTGIGLAIVEKIISKHGGGVWVKAAVNEGACFSFSLPEAPVLAPINNYSV